MPVHLLICRAGHVDSGKSTLMGRLLFDLQAIDERILNQYKKEAERIGKSSFAFAWVLDQGQEERERGVTIDVATNKFETAQTVFTILDAPGHRDFVPNMIAGASEADFAVLVIDAAPGEFESGLRGQTREHVLLVRSMGCSRLVVAVNKMDRIEWSHDRFEDIQQQMSAFLITAGFKKQSVSFVPCSGLLGENILRKSSDAKANWYSGLTLVEELDNSPTAKHALEKPFRLPLSEVVQSSTSSPVVVSGRIEAGYLQVGDEIMCMPTKQHAPVRSILVDGESQDWAVAGQNTTLNLGEMDEGTVRIGDIICGLASSIPNIQSFSAKVLAFDHLLPMAVDIHRGNLHVPGRITNLVAVLDKAEGNVIKNRPKVVQPGTTARITVELSDPAPLEAGRIVLRCSGETVAAGFVESNSS